MDDGHGKLPLVVLNSTTMASKRQYIPCTNKVDRVINSKPRERAIAKFSDERSSSTK